MVGAIPKAPVHVWLDTTYYRWVDWCIHHAPSGYQNPTFFCRFYGCRVSVTHCKEDCRRREGY